MSRDRVLTLAQFEAMAEQAKHYAGREKREARRDKKHNRREVELAIFQARARELGLTVTRGWNHRDLHLPYTVEVNDEIALEISHQGTYCNIVLARRGAARGRFKAAELLLLIDSLRGIRLPYRKPHKSTSKKKARAA